MLTVTVTRVRRDILMYRGKAMRAVKRIYDSIWGKAIIIFMVILVGFWVNMMLRGKEEEQAVTGEEVQESRRNIEYAEMVGEDNVILRAFKEQYPDAEVLLACEEDVTDDGLKDLVVICRLDELTRTIVVTDGGDGETYRFSEPIPGPIENQKIQFKNIDKEGEIEIIITGEKKGAVGYAIYRMIDGEPVDLFGEGMEDCC